MSYFNNFDNNILNKFKKNFKNGKKTINIYFNSDSILNLSNLNAKMLTYLRCM
jgi:hypothetical protein